MDRSNGGEKRSNGGDVSINVWQFWFTVRTEKHSVRTVCPSVRTERQTHFRRFAFEERQCIFLAFEGRQLAIFPFEEPFDAPFEDRSKGVRTAYGSPVFKQRDSGQKPDLKSEFR